ncbi:MAG: hypothetical protein JW719_10520 [Pirellulales bacterium]|nr:hypothetical protein [Pirellulales bacterium]
MSRLEEALIKAYGQSEPSLQTTGKAHPEMVRLSEALGRRSSHGGPSQAGAGCEAVGPSPEPAKFSIVGSSSEQAPCDDAELPDAHVSTRDRSSGTALRPMLQVDAFAWPEALAATVPATDDELDAVAGVLVELHSRRPGPIAMAGSVVGVGCTTLLLGAAQRLARHGANVVLVDADQARPELSSQLGLLPSLGWEDVAAGRQPLAEVLIESIEDRLVLLPLCNREAVARLLSATAARNNMARAVATLRQAYDFVLIDLGTPADATVGMLDGAVETAVLVHGGARATAGDPRAAARRLAARGIACAGVIENFAGHRSRASHLRAA